MECKVLFMRRIYWVGARESDIKTESLFYGSITRYGIDSKKNTSFINNSFTDSYDNFLLNILNEKLNISQDNYFMFSNQINAYKFGRQIYKHSICTNKLSIVESLNNKMFFRQFINQTVNTPPSIAMNISNYVDYNFIKSLFNNYYPEFVVQILNSGGGIGNVIFTENDDVSVLSNLEQPVLITPYLKNALPINVHIAVSNTNVFVFPPSVQIISNMFNYCGSDFIKYSELENNVKRKLYIECQKLGKKIQSIGAIGVFGVDLLLYNDKLFFIECNYRYQGSSFILNRILLENGLPSIFEIHYLSFKDEIKNLPIDLYNIKANYSSFRRTKSNYNIKLPTPKEIITDGNDINNSLRNGYIHYELFDTSIYDCFEK